MKRDSEDILNSYMKADVFKNPAGVDKKVAEQRKKEMNGRFYFANKVANTYIFVKNGDNVSERIDRFNSRFPSNELKKSLL